MKRSKTLTYKLSAFFLSAMTFAMAAGAITTYFVTDRIVKNYITSRLSNSVHEFSKETDDDIVRAETFINGTSYLIESYFKDVTQLDLTQPANKTYVEKSFEEIHEKSGLHHLNNDEYKEISCHYVALNPEYTKGTAADEYGTGFFHTRTKDGFIESPSTNVLKYDESQTEYVGWWYPIANSKKAQWLEPYYDANTERNIFSYVEPLFGQNGEFVGVVGIDIDLEEFIKDIDTVGTYSDAYAFLATSDGKIIYHKDYMPFDENGKYKGSGKTLSELSGVEDFKSSEDGAITYRYGGRRRTAMSISLSNGLVYGVSIRTGELRQPIRIITFIPVLVYVGLLAVLVVGFYLFTIRHVRPLQDLNNAVNKARKGDYKVTIKPKHDDEIGALTKSFTQMIGAIAEKNKIISAMAFVDGLTGVKNTNAYRDAEKRLNDEIKEGNARFAIAILDVDKLKMINDNLGHEAGDRAIIGSCYSLCKGFTHCPVFRIGGDEFVAIVEGEDFENRQEIYEKLKNNQILVRNIKYDFSVGMATYEPGVDHSFKDVFNRADQEMYLNKKAKRRYEQD